MYRHRYIQHMAGTEKIAQNARPDNLSLYIPGMEANCFPVPSVSVRLIKNRSPFAWYTELQEKTPGQRAFPPSCKGGDRNPWTFRKRLPVRGREGKKVFLIGGGIGIPPMLETAKQFQGEKQIILGYRDELFLNKEFELYGKVYVATEDGSAGTKGNVLDAIRENHLEADLIFACGPAPMLRALKAYALEKGIPCWISMEERMACGVGACLACVCRSKDVDAHSHVHNKRVCKDGPVFLSTEVEL